MSNRLTQKNITNGIQANSAKFYLGPLCGPCETSPYLVLYALQRGMVTRRLYTVSTQCN